MASPLELASYVQGQFNQGRERRDTNRLAALASQAYGADPGAQRGLVQQAIATNPDAGFALGQNLRQDRGQRVSQLSQMAKMLVSYAEANNEAGVRGLYPRIAQEAQAVGLGQGIPTEWDPQYIDGMRQLANLGGGDGSTPAGLREFQGMTQGLDPKDVMKARRIALGLDGRASTSGFTQVKFTGSDGRERIGTLNGRTGQIDMADGTSFNPQTGQVSATQPQGLVGTPTAPMQAEDGTQMRMAQFTDANGQPIRFDEGVPAHLAQQIMAQPGAFDSAPSGATAALPPASVPAQQFFSGQQAPAQAPMRAQQPPGGALPPRLDYQRGGSVDPFVGRSAEEQAGLTEAARQQAQLAALPQELSIRTQDAIDRERGVGQAKAETEKAAGQPKAKLALDQATARVERVDTLIDSIMPRINRMTAGWVGDKLSNVAGTDAADLRRDLGTLQAIAGFDELNAMRAASPTGGALGNVTERELAFLQSVVRNIESSQSPEQLRRNLQEFQQELRGSWQRVQRAYEQDYGGQQPGATPTQRLRFNPATGRIE